jgi:outer membrane receptor for ferrienterochelin and colicins
VNGRLPITPALLLTANYTYTDSVRKGGGEPAFDGSSLDGTPLDKTPRHMANVRLDWQATEQIAAYVLGYSGKQTFSGFRNGALNTRTREGTTSMSASISRSMKFALRAAVLNVTDKIVPVDDRGRFDGLDGNWMLDEGRRFWGAATISF